jgi:hypothetical protein
VDVCVSRLALRAAYLICVSPIAYMPQPAADRQNMCGEAVTDPLEPDVKRRARSAPSGKFLRFQYRFA